MSSVSNALELETLSDQSVAWRLLRAKNAPFVIAELSAHLGGETRRRPVSELVGCVESDLMELRMRADMDLPRSGQEYCEQWRSDGYLLRQLVPHSRIETYELSAGAATAIRFVQDLRHPRRSVTQSRLDTIVNRINKIALETDESVERHRQSLIEERARIDEQLERLEAGVLEPVDPSLALEGLEDVVALAREIPADFLHVRADFADINRQLHASIINGDADSNDILEDVFAGVDSIGQSPSGRSFNGFYALLRDDELLEGVQDSIDAILDREFSQGLPPAERQFLRNLLSDFRDQSRETSAVHTAFARALQHFVQTRSYQQERRLKRELDRALGSMHAALDTQPLRHKMRDPLLLTKVDISSVSKLRLCHPLESRVVPTDLSLTDEAPQRTWAQLREEARETDIDFKELTSNVNQELARGRADDGLAPRAPSVAEVLEAHPATQGAASVVGLLSLAVEQGRPREGAPDEVVQWVTKAGHARSARIATLEFYQEVV